MKKAYSYIRFSTEIQMRGDSLRRQIESSEQYCKEKGLELQDINFRDLGVSGWKGKNAKKGALGDFLKACEEEKIEAGSALVVESLDRVSRENPRKVLNLLSTLLDYDIEIHLTLDGKVFYPNTKNEGLDLMYALALAMRGNEESERKSDRLLAVHKSKREKAREKKGLVATSVPWFFKVEGEKENKKIVAPPERVAIVKRIFKDYLNGKSCVQIARDLNNDNVPTFITKKIKGKNQWASNRIKFLIEGNQVLGTLSQSNHAKEVYEIKNYYPVIMDEDTVYQARELLHRKSKRGKETKEGGLINPFRGMIRFEDTFLRFSHKIQGNTLCWYYGAFDLQNNKQTFFCKGLDLEHLLLCAVKGGGHSERFKNNPNNNKPYAFLQRKKSELEKKKDKWLKLIDANEDVEEFVQSLKDVKIELKEIEEKLKKLTPISSFDITPSATELFEIDHKNNNDREKIADYFSRVAKQIVIFTDRDKAVKYANFVNVNKENIWQSSGTYPLDIKKTFYICIHFKNGVDRHFYNIVEEKQIEIVDVKKD